MAVAADDLSCMLIHRCSDQLHTKAVRNRLQEKARGCGDDQIVLPLLVQIPRFEPGPILLPKLLDDAVHVIQPRQEGKDFFLQRSCVRLLCQMQNAKSGHSGRRMQNSPWIVAQAIQDKGIRAVRIEYGLIKIVNVHTQALYRRIP